MEEPGGSSTWTREQEKAFENALVMHPEDVADRWEKILAAVSGKTVEDIKYHYELLVEDIGRIELGRVPFPSYVSFSDGSTDHASEGGGVSKKGIHSGRSLGDSGQGGKASRSDQERRKGIAWTEDEHRWREDIGLFIQHSAVQIEIEWLFLLGLDKYGKGDWRSISRNFVISRTPTQVASHAQKYFIRLNSMNRDRRRSSIHDITSVDPNGDLSSPGPITGQTSTLAVGVRKFANQSPQQPLGPRGIGAYGATAIGQPVGGSLVSAGGAPVNIPALPCMAYGFQAPVPGVPMNFAPVTYPMPHSSAHR